MVIMRPPAAIRLRNHGSRRSEAEPHWYGSRQLVSDLVRRTGSREIGAAAPRSLACENKRNRGGCCCQDGGPEGGARAVCPDRPAAVVLCPDADVAAGRQVRVRTGQ